MSVDLHTVPPAPRGGLGVHMAHCARARGRLHTLRQLGEGLHALLVPRFVSTVAVLALVLAGLAWLAH